MQRPGSILFVFIALILCSCEEEPLFKLSGNVRFKGSYMPGFKDYTFTQSFEKDSFYLLTYTGEMKNPFVSSKTYKLPIERYELVADSSVSPQVSYVGDNYYQLWFAGFRKFSIYDTPIEVYRFTTRERSDGRAMSYYHIFWCPAYGIIMQGNGQTGLHSSDPYTLSSPINSKDSTQVRKLIESIWKDKDFMYYKGAAKVYETKIAKRDTISGLSYTSPMTDNPYKYDEYQEYINANLSYPDSALGSCVYSTIWYTVNITKTDSFNGWHTWNPKTFGEYSPLFDREVKRVVNSIPDFRPSKYLGRIIPTTYQFKFNFELPDYEMCKDTLDAREARATARRKPNIFTIVEQMPTFGDGSEKALRDYVEDNIVYPEDASKENVLAMVYITFVINMEGEIEKPRVLKCKADKYCKQFEDAALSLVGHMPKWNPGKQRGKLVNVQYNLPVKFSP